MIKNVEYLSYVNIYVSCKERPNKANSSGNQIRTVVITGLVGSGNGE